jgi:serine/threonine protein kinase
MAETPLFSSIRGAAVLVVDDNPVNLEVISIILRGSGCNVTLAGTAAEALALLEGALPDLMLLDVMMPEMNGYELCRHVKALPRTSRLPVIFISALTDPDEKVRAFQEGGADYVTKPFYPAEVLARVDHQIKIARLQQALEHEKAQLLYMNRELLRSQQQTAVVFGLLSEQLPGQVIDGKYRLDEKIGSGGFSVVYRAMHLGLQRSVAVKIFQPSGTAADEANVKRFLQEGISACLVSHPNTVAVLDSGVSAQGIPFLVMDLLNGHTLTAELHRHRKLPLSRCIEIVVPICHVLIEAHAAGVVHRDIKPENVFLHVGPEGEVVKVLDFGIARMTNPDPQRMNPRLTRAEGIIGTPIYMAPERVRNEECDGRADVYSLGVMLYTMLAGRTPFRSEKRDVINIMHDHLNKAPPRLRTFCPDLPDQVEAAVMSALTKDPRRRPSAREFLNALQAAYKESKPVEEPSSISARQKQTTVVLFAEFRNQPAEPRANTMPIPVPPQGFVAISLNGDSAAPVQPNASDEFTPERVDEEEGPTLDLDMLQRQDTHDEPESEGQVLNSGALDQLQRLGLLNGSDVAPELIQVFRRDAEMRLTTLRQALADQDKPVIERTAHSLKSSCGNLGAERLQALCQNIENLSRQGRTTGLERLLVRLQEELTLFNGALDDYLARSSTAASPSPLNPTIEASQA